MHMPGIPMNTAAPGTGLAGAVRIALAERMAAARFNTPEHTIFDYHVVCLAGDGCMQEGVAMEACAFAGHQKLDNLILIYDSNDVTLDAMADKTQSENIALRFKAMNWEVQTLTDGHDLAAILKAVNKAKKAKSGTLSKTQAGKVATRKKGEGAGAAMH